MKVEDLSAGELEVFRGGHRLSGASYRNRIQRTSAICSRWLYEVHITGV